MGSLAASPHPVPLLLRRANSSVARAADCPEPFAVFIQTGCRCPQARPLNPDTGGGTWRLERVLPCTADCARQQEQNRRTWLLRCVTCA